MLMLCKLLNECRLQTSWVLDFGSPLPTTMPQRQSSLAEFFLFRVLGIAKRSGLCEHFRETIDIPTKVQTHIQESMGSVSVLFFPAAAVFVIFIGVNDAQLSYDYYKSTCPNLESKVKQELLNIFLTDITAPAALLRLMFHDCQVQGCDASILLDSNAHKTTSEVISSKNFGIRKQEIISSIKHILEKQCPGQVSCADIIALAARESVSFSGGPHIRIHLGRKDSYSSSKRQADTQLPSPSINVNDLVKIFRAKGLNLEEAVAILGAHTLGGGHCINIVDRLYHPKRDDSMDYNFRAQLLLDCPTQVPLTNLTVVPSDLTPLAFDNQYYKDLLMGRGLLGIDSSISRDRSTSPIVERFAIDQNYFFQVFSSAFVKLSLTNVLTKKDGEVRRKCNQVNE